MEGALKLKEMSYIHAEGYSGGALKHGPFALIEGDDVSWSFVLFCFVFCFACVFVVVVVCFPLSFFLYILLYLVLKNNENKTNLKFVVFIFMN